MLHASHPPCSLRNMASLRGVVAPAGAHMPSFFVDEQGTVWARVAVQPVDEFVCLKVVVEWQHELVVVANIWGSTIEVMQEVERQLGIPSGCQRIVFGQQRRHTV